MPRISRERLIGVVLMALAMAIAGVIGSAAIAAGASPERQPSLDRMVRFLQESQRLSGGFAPAGKKPSQGISAWVALALAAAGINPQDQATCGVDAFSFLEDHFSEGLREELAWPATATTAFERELLVVDAADTDPHDFAGTDLVGEILGRRLANGSFPYVPGGRGEVNDTVFAILALGPIDAPVAREAVQEGAEWLLTQQNDDGGWSWQVKGEPSEVDLTGAAIQALNVAGQPDTEAQRAAFQYLHTAQRADGGFAEFPQSESESNVASTAWAVQGLWAAGENPEGWRTGSGELSEEPLNYMESMQQPDGHVRWKKSIDMNGIWMTAYVAPAFAGQALPIAAVPRALPSASPAGASETQELPSSCEEPAAGGKAPTPGAQSPAPGDGVLAGGGAAGAPLFSRPKPQSEGRTPGGARLIHSKDLHPADHSKVRRGANAKQPSGAESSEPADPSAVEAEVSVVGSATGSDGDAGAGAPAVIAEAPQAGPSQAGREVTGTLIGSLAADRGGEEFFGAPGLHSASQGGGGREIWLALGIGIAALLVALAGVQWERRRGELVL